ncbi:MAG: signal peptidase II [Lachnospiraceae bacterium]|nr:signal peptidase II [Lachnospiraceae bacterium]
MKKYASKLICALACALLVLTDQLTKNWMVANLKGRENIVWIKNVFELEYLENNGAAFSSFMGKQGFLITLTVIVTLVALIEFIRIPESKRYAWLHVAFMLLIAGALGNLIDRVKQGYVVDFFYFVPINFPRFNVADICVTLAVPIFLILFFFVYKEEETEFLFKFKKADNKAE